jgi:SMODS and SLOG-associating 2TM effector domain family 4
MFALTLVDHLRLTFGHVIYAHRTHAQLALTNMRWHRVLVGGEALLMLGAALASITLATTAEMAYAIVTAVASSLAVLTLLARLVFEFEGRAGVHRVCAARLWYIREQYRAALADLQDGTLTLEAARFRRDELMRALQEVYETAPPAERGAYEAARNAVAGPHEAALTDDEVDRFLPKSMQKGDKSAA